MSLPKNKASLLAAKIYVWPSGESYLVATWAIGWYSTHHPYIIVAIIVSM